MYSLPKATQLNTSIPKRAIFEKFKLTYRQRQLINDDIARIDIIGRIAEDTLPAIAVGKEVKVIFVLSLSLKRMDYSNESLLLLGRYIPQKMLLVLAYESMRKLVVIHNGIHASEWVVSEELKIPLGGLNYDAVWENMVASIGQISRTEGQSLDEGIERKRQEENWNRQIMSLQKKIKSERSLKKQMTYYSEMMEIRKVAESELLFKSMKTGDGEDKTNKN